MKDLVVYKKINKNLKLCRVNLYTKFSLNCIVSISTSLLPSLIIAIETNSKPNFLITSTITGFTSIFMSNMLSKDPIISDIKLLKDIKRELNSGINRFANVTDDKFSVELNNYKLENRIKELKKTI